MATNPKIAVLYFDERELGIVARLLDLIQLTEPDSIITPLKLEGGQLPVWSGAWDAVILVGTAGYGPNVSLSDWLDFVDTIASKAKVAIFSDKDEGWVHKVRNFNNMMFVTSKYYLDLGSDGFDRTIVNFLLHRNVVDATDKEPGDSARDSDAVRVAAARTVANLQQAPLGAVFEAEAEKLVIDSSGTDTDFEAAGSPIVSQLHQEIIRKTDHFAAVAMRLDNQVGWQGIRGLCERLSLLLKRPTGQIPDVLGSLYSATLEMGSFLELDLAIGRGDASFAAPLDAEARRPLEDLVRSLAPWMRRFPTIRQMDDDAAQFLVADPPLKSSEEVVNVAARIEILDAEDAAALQGLITAGERGEFQGEKAGNRGTLSVRNMIVVVAGLLGSFMWDAVASDFATKSVLVKKAGTFLSQAEAPLMEVVAGLPYDIRYAIQAILRGLQDSPVVPPRETPSPAREKTGPVRRRGPPRE